MGRRLWTSYTTEDLLLLVVFFIRHCLSALLGNSAVYPVDGAVSFGFSFHHTRWVFTKKWVKKRRIKPQQIWAVCKCFGVRNKGTSMYRADLHRCFGFLWLELGPLHASNNNPLRLSLLPLSCLAGQTGNFHGNFCTSECIDIWHFAGTESTLQLALGCAPVGLILHFLSVPLMCGCFIWKGQILQRVCFKKNWATPFFAPEIPSPKQTAKSQSQMPLFSSGGFAEWCQSTALWRKIGGSEQTSTICKSRSNRNIFGRCVEVEWALWQLILNALYLTTNSKMIRNKWPSVLSFSHSGVKKNTIEMPLQKNHPKLVKQIELR